MREERREKREGRDGGRGGREGNDRNGGLHQLVNTCYFRLDSFLSQPHP